MSGHVKEFADKVLGIEEEETKASPVERRVIKPCPYCQNEAKHYPETHSQANAIYCTECPLGVEQAGMSDEALMMVWNNLPRAV